MIRLTLMLLAAIMVTMIVAGEEPDQVAAGDFDGPDLIGRAEADTAPAANAGATERLALEDEAGAIARALAATGRPKPEALPADVQEASRAEPVADSTTEADDAWYVTGSRVNLRAGPSTADPVVGRVSRGQEAEFLGESEDGWMQIRLPEDGQTAYIYGRFLSETPS